MLRVVQSNQIEEVGEDKKSQANTVELHSRVRAVAMEVSDFYLLGRLSAGDMVALKSLYHKQCLVALYAHTRQ